MSIFSRVRDLLSANINAMLDNAEDPEKMADEYLRQLNNELYEAKTSVAAAMADAMKLNTRETQYTAETEQWSNKAEAALRGGDEALAKAALARKVQATKLAQQYRSSRTRRINRSSSFNRPWCSLKHASPRPNQSEK